MPLKIRVKPEGKIFAGGAVLKNVSSRPVDLLVLSDSPVLRDDYLANVENRDDSDIGNICFLLQIVYLYKGKGKPLDDLVVRTIHSFALLYPNLKDQVEEIILHLETGDAFKALKVAHKLLAERSQSAATDAKETAENLVPTALAPTEEPRASV